MAKKSEAKGTKSESPLKPDPETLHKTDPQENMEGPVSSLMQNLAEDSDDKNESKVQADKKKDKNT